MLLRQGMSQSSGGGDELCFDWSQANNQTQNTCFEVCEQYVSGVLM